MGKKTVIQRLERLGFSVFASRPSDRDLVNHVGGIFVVNFPKAKCGLCNGKYLYTLHEVAVFQVPEIKILVFKIPFFLRTYVDANPVCLFCNSCGAYLLDTRARRIGVIGGNLQRKGSLFSVLDEIESNGSHFAEDLTLEDLQKMEAYLNNRLRILKLKIAAKKAPYRGS